MAHTWYRSVLVALLLGLLAACGGDNNTQTDTPQPDPDAGDMSTQENNSEGDMGEDPSDMGEDPSDMASPDMAAPDSAEPDMVITDMADPDMADPDMADPDMADPDVVDPDVVEPDMADPDMDEPDMPGPQVGQQKLTPAVLRAMEQLDARHLALGVDGVPGFVVGALGQVEMASDDQEMMGELAQVVPGVAPMFQLDPADLQVEELRRDEVGFLHARYRQQRDGLPVVGGDFMLHVNDQGQVFAVNGAAPPMPEIREATVSPQEASDATAQRYEGAVVDSGEPVEVYVVASFDQRLYRAWQVTVEGTRTLQDGSEELVHDDVFIDAYNGGVLDVHPHVHVIKQIGIYDAMNNDTGSAEYLGQTAEELPETDNAAWGAWENANLAYDCLSEVFGRDSFDGRGQVIRSVVHFGTRYNNAFWYPGANIMYYGDGDGELFGNLAESYDVTVHEMSHAVTTYSANLTYMNESGALNESFSDIMASVCETWHRGVVNGDTWRVGESVFTPGTPGDALRYMNHPTVDGYSTDYYPTRYQGSEDNGGVHLNSGISNLAFYLMAQGGSHPRNLTSIDVTPVGMDRAAQIFYRAMVYYMTPSTTFSQARAATAQAALDLYDEETAQRVHAAWSAVGVEAAPVVDPVSDEITPLQNGQMASGLAGDSGDAHLFKLQVPEGSTHLVITMDGGAGDADLYVRLGLPPTQSQWDARPYQAGNAEVVTVEQPQSGDWFVMVHGFQAFSEVTLHVAFTAMEPLPTTEDNCFDQADNDGDQAVDCEDSDCAQWPACNPEPATIEPGALVITEIMANPTSGEGDPRHEWFEVHNTTGQALDLLGLEVTDGDGTPERVHTIQQSVTVEAGGYAVLAYSAGADLGFVPDYIYGTTRLVLANSGDNILLRRADGVVIDEVDYAAEGFPGALPGVALSTGALDAQGNDDGAAWCGATEAFNEAGELGTPGQAGGCGAQGALPPSAGSLVITEIMYNPGGDEPGAEWFEVLALEGPLELRGVQLGSGIRAHTLEPSVVVEAGQRLVFCRDSGLGPQGCVDYERLQLANGGGVLTLTGADGVELDRVTYEATWPWPESSNGVSIELSEDHLNSQDNDSGQLWCYAQAPLGEELGSPGAPGACSRVIETRQARPPLPGEVVITEIQYSAPSEPYGEWFEVWVQASDDTEWLDVQGVTLTTASTTFVIDVPLLVPSGALVVGCRDAELGPPDCLQYESLRLRNTGDTLSIFSAEGELLDAVSYGVGGDWPAFQDGYSLELNVQRHDPAANDDPANWCQASGSYDEMGLEYGTPHQPNQCGYIEPVEPQAGDLVISEIMYNPEGTEPLGEWIEIYNLGQAPVRLQGVQVGSGEDVGPVEADAVLGVGQYAVLCYDAQAGPAGCLVYTGDARFNNSPDQVTLLSAQGVELDTVAYGTSGDWPASSNGVSIELSRGQLSPQGNDEGAAWCQGSASFSGGQGSPGRENDCP